MTKHNTFESSDSDLDESKKIKKSLCSDIKRKREKMKYTNCKARMIIKFNGNMWFLKQFTNDHNHNLLNKPSLSEFPRSQAGMTKKSNTSA